MCPVVIERGVGECLIGLSQTMYSDSVVLSFLSSKYFIHGMQYVFLKCFFLCLPISLYPLVLMALFITHMWHGGFVMFFIMLGSSLLNIYFMHL